MKLPFNEEKSKGRYIRTFSSNVPINELKWHWDEQDRIVVCEHDTDWKFQLDNELPFTIKKNIPIFISEGQYHRIIKGTGDLTVKINKLK